MNFDFREDEVVVGLLVFFLCCFILGLIWVGMLENSGLDAKVFRLFIVFSSGVVVVRYWVRFFFVKVLFSV